MGYPVDLMSVLHPHLCIGGCETKIMYRSLKVAAFLLSGYAESVSTAAACVMSLSADLPNIYWAVILAIFLSYIRFDIPILCAAVIDA